MYTIMDVIRNKVKLNNETDILTIDVVRGISFKMKKNKIKYVRVHVGLITFVFKRRVKDILKAKIKKDLGHDFSFKIVI